MDRKELYKPKGNTSKYTLSAAKKKRTETRTEQRNELYLTRRQNLLATDEESSTTAAPTINKKNEIKLTKQQAHYNKFLDWQKQKLELKSKKLANTTKPFTSAVPSGHFMDKIDKKTQILRLPQPQPIDIKIAADKNQPDDFKMPSSTVVTRSKVQTKVASPLKTKNQQKELTNKLKVFVPSVTSTSKKETKPSDSEIKKPIKSVEKMKPIKRVLPTRSATTTTAKLPPVVVKSTKPKAIKKLNLVAVQPAPIMSPEIISPIYPPTPQSKVSVEKVVAPSAATDVPTTSPPITTTNAIADNLNTTPINSPSLNRSINYVSPFVTTSRGKTSAKKEQKHRDSVYKLDLNQSIDEPIEVRRNREAVAYFRNQLEQETERLLAIVSEWDAYKMENEKNMESEYVDMIDVAIGQTRLLTTKKFMQFSSLVDQCEAGKDYQKVFATDLEGFWSMVYMQVENCDKRFEKLTKLKSDNWIDVELMPKPKLIVKRKKKQQNLSGKTVDRRNTFLDLMNHAKAQYAKHKQLVGDVVSKVNSPVSARKSNSLLLTVLNKETFKNVSSPKGQSPITRRSSTHNQSPKLRRKSSSSSSKENSPTKLTKSILKTPGTKRKGKSVVFKNLRESLENRRQSSPSNGAAKKLQLDSDNVIDVNASVSNNNRRMSLQSFKINQNDAILKTPQAIRNMNFDGSFSPDGARRSSRLAARKF